MQSPRGALGSHEPLRLLPDSAATPDHRPVRARLALGGTAGPQPATTPTLQDLLSRLTAIEAELARLRRDIEALQP